MEVIILETCFPELVRRGINVTLHTFGLQLACGILADVPASKVTVACATMGDLQYPIHGGHIFGHIFWVYPMKISP